MLQMLLAFPQHTSVALASMPTINIFLKMTLRKKVFLSQKKVVAIVWGI